ncbi:MAG: hypothetical protein IT294_02995 [Deltaproteobacteria bacterium]|nr:hypothetical protein [Deltaproteobacteria bacterium]
MATAPTGLSRIVRDPAPAVPAHTPSGAIEAPALAAVVRIVELQLRQVPLDTLTADALPAMLDLFEAPAGALLLYRREDAVLTLAAARGLAVAGAEALGVLRWGDEATSEMPLRALVDRKIYVVAAPAEDPFIRRLIDTRQRRPVSSVAAVPLYRWHLPVGVLLVLGGAAPLASEALRAPGFAYAVLALALSTMMWAREERGATPLPASDVAPPPLECAPWVDRRERAEAAGERRTTNAAERAEDRSALDTMLRELRGVVARMDVERRETARERDALTDRLASYEQELLRLAAQLTTTEADRNLLASRLASLEELLAAKRSAGAVDQASPVAAVAAPATAPAAPAPPSAVAPATGPEPAPPRAPLPDSGDPPERHVLEADPILRDRIQAALASAVPVDRGGLAVVNLAGCDRDRIDGMMAANRPGMPLVGYAADAERGRILGPLRCFVTPPSAAEISAVVEGAGRGNRRTILLTEDIDGFMEAKAALVKAGHSVSMACDEKQALDLLAILRPDTVMIDVRNAGQPAAEFLDALGPESGRVLTMIVHGDPTGASLGRIAEQMLRPSALDVTELAKVCRNALPDARRTSAASARR